MNNVKDDEDNHHLNESTKDQMIYALELVNSEKFDEANREFDLLIASVENPEIKRDALFQKGITLSNMGLFVESITVFKKILDMKLQFIDNPKKIELLLKISEAHLALKEVENSKKYLKEVIELEPRNISALLNIAKILGHEKKFDQSEECCDMILDVDSKCGEALFLKGLCLKQMKLFDESIECFKRSLPLLENKSEVCLQIGTIYAKTYDNSKRSSIWIKKALTYDRTNAFSWYCLALTRAENYFNEHNKLFKGRIHIPLNIAINLDPELIETASKEAAFIQIVNVFVNEKKEGLEEILPKIIISKIDSNYFTNVNATNHDDKYEILKSDDTEEISESDDMKEINFIKRDYSKP